MTLNKEFSSGLKKQLLNELENLTNSMDIPLNRQKDPHWLLHFLEMNNADHKNTKKILQICKFLISKE